MAYVKVLGAYGGRSAHKHTTSFRISDEIVIDAGNIIGGLGDDASKVRHIFLTHAHFDHIIDIPFLVDSLFGEMEESITIHALPHTIASIKEHLMNNELWPDFSTIRMPANGKPAVKYHEITLNETYEVGKYKITPVAANHVVPTCGFIVEKEGSALMLSGDTYLNTGLPEILNKRSDISVLMLEVSFPSRLHDIAYDSKHLTPLLVSQMLEAIERKDLKICFYHMKPSYKSEIEQELSRLIGNTFDYRILDDYDIIEYAPV